MPRKTKASNLVSKDLKFGRTTYPGGRIVELMSPHQEWLDWAVDVIEEAAKQEAAKKWSNRTP